MTLGFSAILFDLDGTIVDSAPGITTTLAWTFEQLGLPTLSPAELVAFVGPPILESFREYGHLSHDEAERALSIYRPRYLEHGIFGATLYPGVRETLAAIHARGIPLSLATSKPETPAKMILEHYDVIDYFDVITGASDDEKRSAEADVVELALERLAEIDANLSRPVMVGDRSHDVAGAAANGVSTIFVRWGYGSPAEEAGTIAAVDTAKQLDAALFGQ